MTSDDSQRDWLEAALSFASQQHIDPATPAGTTLGPRRDEDTLSLNDPALDLPVVTVDDAPAPVEQEPRERVTADLHVLRRLGQGGMAVVDSAWQRSLAREVAVKRLREDQHDELASRGLLAEARITGQLEHPNVIPVHSLGRGDDGFPLMVMKQVVGVTWHKLIIRPDHPGWDDWPGDRLTRHVEFLIRVCRAVEYAHASDIGHLDIKPGNVMIGGFGEVYLMDWGLAARFDRLGDLPEKELVGTPGFMAPEMLLGRRATSPVTDVYLLGSTLHFALTGDPRHEGDDLSARLHNALHSPSYDYDVTVPSQLAWIANKACARLPRNRYRSARELREALEQFLTYRSSMRIGDAAQRQLEQLDRLLEAPDEGPRAAQLGERRQTLATEARFGFEQALHDWPENRRARLGLQRARVLSIEFELRRENPAPALALLRARPSRELLTREGRSLLEALVRSQSPAHTEPRLELGGGKLVLGEGTQVGIHTTLGGPALAVLGRQGTIRLGRVGVIAAPWPRA